MGERAIIYTRVSTEMQGEGTSLDTQQEACEKLASELGYEVRPEHIIREMYSGLTMNRPKLQDILGYIKNSEIDALVVYSSDRFSRDGYDLLTLIRECDIHGVKIHSVMNDIESGPMGELMNFVRGWSDNREVAKFVERAKRGRKRNAEEGKIPSGFGPGYLGLRYDKEAKKFDHVPGQIEVVKEIIERGLTSESINSIATDLQKRGIKTTTGIAFHRSAVHRVFTNAKVYAGVITWKGIEISGKVEPIITLDVADKIAERMKENKKRSYGFGKRTWLGGRVFCEICGRRYRLDSRRGCRCHGDSKYYPNRCNAQKLGLKELSELVWQSICTAHLEPEIAMEQAVETRRAYEKELEVIREMEQRCKDRENQRERRRRLLSVQHEHGGIVDEEYFQRLEDIQKESDGELKEIKRFNYVLEPPTIEEIRETLDVLQSYYPLADRTEEVLRNPQDEVADQLAEKLGLKVIIGPPRVEGHKFYAHIIMNAPILTGEWRYPSPEKPVAMVFESSGNFHHGLLRYLAQQNRYLQSVRFRSY
ncbi:MAG: recombinase family protein [Chloroflexi bacterium]|nr:recombinase family protein [Chloroflexota bacterium]